MHSENPDIVSSTLWCEVQIQPAAGHTHPTNRYPLITPVIVRVVVFLQRCCYLEDDDTGEDDEKYAVSAATTF